jgi:phage terminase large subunit-like protein
METGMGTRSQPMMVAATTAGNDPASWPKRKHDEMVRISEDPARSPRTFVYIRNVPQAADPWDESLWPLGNPALGAFLKMQVLRDEAQEARDDRTKENAFRQFRLNQWVQQTTRYISMDLWRANCREIAATPEWLVDRLQGQRCWAGLDLSSKLDMTAWSLVFADGTVLWRFWVPETVVPVLDKYTGDRFGLWVRDGWVTATEGDVIDYDVIYDAIAEDNDRYAIENVTYDRWSGEPVRQAVVARTGLSMVESGTTYDKMTAPMKELLRGLKAREFNHGGNPVAEWMADALEAKSPTDDPERVRPVKPDRAKTGKRIDGMVAMLLALDGRLTPAADLPAADIF